MSNIGRSIPTVMCPGCQKPMRLMLLEPASDKQEAATYRCEHCGTETRRQIGREEKG